MARAVELPSGAMSPDEALRIARDLGVRAIRQADGEAELAECVLSEEGVAEFRLILEAAREDGVPDEDTAYATGAALLREMVARGMR